MNRFVILEHDWPHLHFDLFLEAGDVLRSWRIATEPTSGVTHRAEARPDHRRFYLDYEGPVSDGRGTVTRWDAGTFEWLHVEHERIVVQLIGERLCGIATLQQYDGEEWTFYCPKTSSM